MEINCWQPLWQVEPELIPSNIFAWLEKPYILTQALKNVCKDFSIRVIEQKEKSLNDDEADILKCQINSKGLVRQTYLLGNKVPLVYARVTIPWKTFEIRRAAFEKLGNQPIGETMLYNDPSVSRSDFEIKCIKQDDPLLYDAVKHQAVSVNELWARRSVFYLQKNPLLITEVFFPFIPSYHNSSHIESPVYEV